MGTASIQNVGERERRPFDEGDPFFPRFDVHETERAYVFRADLPGVKTRDLEVTIDGDTLTIRGTREDDDTEEEIPFRTVVAERTLGEFSRSFTLPAPVDQLQLRATLHDGVLRLSVPKARGGSRESIAPTSRADG